MTRLQLLFLSKEPKHWSNWLQPLLFMKIQLHSQENPSPLTKTNKQFAHIYHSLSITKIKFPHLQYKEEFCCHRLSTSHPWGFRVSPILSFSLVCLPASWKFHSCCYQDSLEEEDFPKNSNCFSCFSSWNSVSIPLHHFPSSGDPWTHWVSPFLPSLLLHRDPAPHWAWQRGRRLMEPSTRPIGGKVPCFQYSL